METQSGKRKAEIGLPTSSRQQKRARVHLFRDHARYTLGPITCIDNVDNARVGYHQMASYFLNYRWRRRAESEKPKSDFQLRVDSRNVRECTCLETHIPRNGHTLCRHYATIKHFVKFVTTVFSLRMAVGIM